MFQTQYSKPTNAPHASVERSVAEVFEITAVRPSMWEEHCLECSAPQCFDSCSLYEPRVDGRCKRFENGIEIIPRHAGLPEGKGARVRFKPWGNLLTIIYPGFTTVDKYANPAVGFRFIEKILSVVAGSRLPKGIIWPVTRTVEFIRRRVIRSRKLAQNNQSDAFVLHAFSHHPETFNLILEVCQDNLSVYRTSFTMGPGENLHVITRGDYSEACELKDNTLKIYPENDVAADIVFYWCHFVQGRPISTNTQPDKYVKCLVWDLDRTLWDSVLIESDDPEVLRLRENVLPTIKELDRRGILQSIASKNDYEPAMAQLRRLGVDEYFLFPQINWGPKSDSLKRIAEMLNINLDSFAFVDDSVFEREQVASQFPQVRVTDEARIGDLLNMDPFCVEVTSESSQRRETYRSEIVRRDYRDEKSLDLSGFIRECNITIKIFNPESLHEIDRCFELIQRTNQLNISGKKYSRAEFETILKASDRESIAFSCEDKFGKYGIVCFAQYHLIQDTLKFLEFAMSCRVAGKHIENAFLNYIKESTEAKNCLFPVIKTAKNELMRRTLSEIGLPAEDENEQQIVFDFSGNLKNTDDIIVESQSGSIVRL